MQHRDPSSEDNNLIRPADFSFGREQTGGKTAKPGTSSGTRPTGNPRLRTALLGTLLLIGIVGVFFVLPQMVEKPARTPLVAANTDTTSEQPSPAKIQASPYSDAEVAQQRRKVQEVLQEILLLQEELEERKADIWAGEDFSAALGLAEEADGIYRQRKFKAALDKYQQALTALQQLRDSIPERIEEHLADGHDALDKGDAEAAHAAFDLVLTISEDHPRGVKGKERAEKLPEVWPHYTRGQQSFSDNELDTARDALRDALQVDPETRPAKELLPQVLAAIKERDYAEAMSAGYAAISEEDFAAAKAKFQRAQALKPDAKDPATGLQQANNGLEQRRIEQLFSRARQQEQSEDWHGAEKSYAALLKKDASLVSAITGKARAEARAKLDDQLQELLEDPLTLSGPKRNQYARQVLADARGINSDTPRLQGQIENLETALTKALIPVPVRLQSDSTTRVTIYHVGQLGNFAEREITLKPGRYTAVGTRAGYRDVRREFTVQPGEDTQTVVIQCAEKIISANNS